MSADVKAIYTIGHSTRSSEEFLELLQAHGIQEVVDVRGSPTSRRYPQFNAEQLAAALQAHGIAYRHLEQLGGHRRARKDSPNSGWRNASFRGYADYMQTPAFEEGLEALKNEARGRTVAFMCAEAVPWRCHRSLIADALSVQGWQVLHIQSCRTARPHTLTPFLRIEDDGRLLYPPSANSDEAPTQNHINSVGAMAAPRPWSIVRLAAGEAEPSPLREDADDHDLTGFDINPH